MVTNSRPRLPPPIVLPAERHDIPELVRIYLDAESTNLLHNLMFSSRKKQGREVVKLLEDNFDNPHLLLVKAVDAESGDITAMAAWIRRGYTAEELGISAPEAAVKNLHPLQLNAGIVHADTEEKSPPGLGQYINDQMKSFLDEWTKDLKHISLELLMTDPRYQRRGIGTAMLKWGHAKAGESSPL